MTLIETFSSSFWMHSKKNISEFIFSHHNDKVGQNREIGTNQSLVNANIKQAEIIRTKDNVANLQGVRDQSANIMFADVTAGADHFHCMESQDLSVPDLRR